VLSDDDPLPILDSLQVIGQMIFQGLDTDFRHSASSLPEVAPRSARLLVGAPHPYPPLAAGPRAVLPLNVTPSPCPLLSSKA